MACKRSAVRSRLAPPAFACFASYGSASHAVAHRSEASEGCRVVARKGEDGPSVKAFFPASYRSASHAVAHPSEASEGCRVVARKGEDGPSVKAFFPRKLPLGKPRRGPS